MKTAIVHVETFDDVTSIRDKITWGRSDRILLVLPRQKKPFPGRVELNLIQRSVKENGAVLALVSRSDITREYANSLGIPVFRSIPEAERGDWSFTGIEPHHVGNIKGKAALLELRVNLPATGNGKPLDNRIRLGLFIVSILAIFVLAFYILPSAHIVIYPETERQELMLNVRANTAVKQVNITGLIPAYKGVVTVSGQKTGKSSGLVPVGMQKAEGEVLFRNLTDEEIVLPSGTIVSTAGESQTRFRTITSVTLPPGSARVGALVEAVNPGVAGNIQAVQIAVVEGIFGAKIEANNTEAFKGGSSQNLAAPVTQDYTLIRYQLLDALEDQAQGQLELESASGKNIIEGSLVLSEVITEEQLNEINQPSDTFTLVMSANFSYLYYDPAHLEDLVNRVMNLSIPAEYHVAKGRAALINRGDIKMHENGEASWTVNASREIIRDLEVEYLLGSIRGKPKAEAVEILNKNFPQLRSAKVFTFVEWWPWLPLLTSRITLEEGSTNEG